MGIDLPGKNPDCLALPDWRQPLDMLDACHGHIRQRLQTIWRLADHLPRHGADAAARQAATEVLRYFSVAAANHHEDEERDLFPALLAVAPRTERRATQALINRLLDEHQRLAVLCEPLMARLLDISQGRPAGEIDAGAIEAFAALSIEHMRVETEELMPLARRLLTPGILQSLSITMSVRRGVKLEELRRSDGPR